MELCMRTKERDRLKILEQLAAQLIGTDDGAARLGMRRRQAQRLVAEYRRRGDAAAIHGLRGQPSNNAKPAARRAAALARVGDCYADYGPTLAAEALAEAQVIAVNRETLRLWMIAEGLWKGARQGRRQRRRRERRRCFGELVQMDTSIHDWLEGRGPRLALIAMIDDATGQKLLRFFPVDSSEANMDLIAAWIARHGRPAALYTDAASHFRPPQQAGHKPPRTQIERALGELDIRLIVARSPQAKGRVERSHGTDQDRLVKGLRQAGAWTLPAANRYLEEVYLPKINAKFAKPAADPADAHRSAAGCDLEAILCVQERRRVANDWTVSIDGRAWQIEPGQGAEQLRGRWVIVERRRDGNLRLRWGDRYLRFTQSAGAVERRLREERPARAVDLTPCGQPAPGDANAGRPDRLPPGLEQLEGSQARLRVVHKLHSPDDDPTHPDSTLKTLKTPVRIPNCTRTPSPTHPWR
jgi:hypothetical protein